MARERQRRSTRWPRFAVQGTLRGRWEMLVVESWAARRGPQLQISPGRVVLGEAVLGSEPVRQGGGDCPSRRLHVTRTRRERRGPVIGWRFVGFRHSDSHRHQRDSPLTAESSFRRCDPYRQRPTRCCATSGTPEQASVRLSHQSRLASGNCRVGSWQTSPAWSDRCDNDQGDSTASPTPRRHEVARAGSAVFYATAASTSGFPSCVSFHVATSAGLITTVCAP